MNENLNLVSLLKDVPKGTRFYCSMFGYVELDEVSEVSDHPIHFTKDDGFCESVTTEGKWNLYHPNGECVFFPSKEQRDWGVWAKEQEEKKKQLLPVDTPVMVCFFMDGRIIEDWRLRCYAGGNKCFDRGYKSTDEVDANTWDVIIPFDKFDPNNIEESLKHNIIELYDTQKRKIGRPQTSVSQI